MNPYRLALHSAHASTCHDSPRAACDPPTQKIKRVDGVTYLLAASFGVAVATGGFALHAIGHGGHIEIAPAALAHVRTHMTKKQTKTRARIDVHKKETVESQQRAELAWVIDSHDPKALTKRAKELAAIGLDMTVVDVPLPRTLTQWTDLATNYFPMQSVPVRGVSSHVDALEIRGLPESSPLRVAGLANGDQLLAVDGYRFDDDSFRQVDVLAIRARGSMAVELSREGHHVLLSIRWATRSQGAKTSG